MIRDNKLRIQHKLMGHMKYLVHYITVGNQHYIYKNTLTAANQQVKTIRKKSIYPNTHVEYNERTKHTLKERLLRKDYM